MSRYSRQHSEYQIGEAIQQMLEETHLARPCLERRIVRLWNELMGPLAAFTLKVELKADTLYVTVSSPLVKQELNMLKDEILQKLHQWIDEKYLKKIVIR